MASNVAETVIGAVVLGVAAAFLVYAANTADVSVGGGGYALTAEFRKAEGLNTGAEVQISGVKVGSVREISLNPETYFARVEMSIRDGIAVPEDSVAKIASEGLLGGTFIALDPGGSEFMLESGDTVEHTQGSVNMLDLIIKFGQGTGS